MTWFRVDDGFSDHPKVLRLRAGKMWKGALALWTLAGSWSSKHEEDGFVPEHVVRHLGGTKAEAEALVAAELWERIDGGYLFHDWTKCNPSRADLDAKREQTRNRVDKWRRERVTGKPSNDVGNALPTQRVTPPPSLPVPSLPIPTKKERERESAREGAETLVRQEFARRFERAEGSMWTRSGDPGVGLFAAWLASLPGALEANLARTLDAFFADPWCRSKHFPIAHLARDAHKYFEPRAAPQVRLGKRMPTAAPAGHEEFADADVNAQLERLGAM